MQHRHRWTVIDVQQGQAQSPLAVMAGLTGPTTRLLVRCDCGEHETRLISGHWPRERFITEEPSQRERKVIFGDEPPRFFTEPAPSSPPSGGAE